MLNDSVGPSVDEVVESNIRFSSNQYNLAATVSTEDGKYFVTVFREILPVAKPVVINWSALGSVPISLTSDYIDLLYDAVYVAEEFNKDPSLYTVYTDEWGKVAEPRRILAVKRDHLVNQFKGLGFVEVNEISFVKLEKSVENPV